MERDGERWREKERDGERWREMERDGGRIQESSVTEDAECHSNTIQSETVEL